MHPLILRASYPEDKFVIANINGATVVVFGHDTMHARRTITGAWISFTRRLGSSLSSRIRGRPLSPGGRDPSTALFSGRALLRKRVAFRRSVPVSCTWLFWSPFRACR
jgi:hypothetical protein